MTTYENATPELLKNKMQIRDRLYAAYKKTAQECTELRTVLGLDNPEALTYTGAEEDARLIRYNQLFYKLCDTEPGFCDLYSSNPAAGEAVLKARMLSDGEDEEC